MTARALLCAGFFAFLSTFAAAADHELPISLVDESCTANCKLRPPPDPEIECEKVNWWTGKCRGPGKMRVCWYAEGELKKRIEDQDHTVVVRANAGSHGGGKPNGRMFDETNPSASSGIGEFRLRDSKKCPSGAAVAVRSQKPHRPTFDAQNEARWRYDIEVLDADGNKYGDADPEIIVKGPGNFTYLPWAAVVLVGAALLTLGVWAMRRRAARSA